MSAANTQDWVDAHSYEDVPFSQSLTPDRTVIDAFRHRVRTQGDAPYITTPSAGGGSTTLTYQDVDVRSRQMARWLRDAGVDPGSTVCLAPTNDLTSVVTIYALLRTGCRTLLTSPSDPVARVTEQAGALGVEVALRPATSASGDALALPVALELRCEPVETDADLDPLGPALYFGTSGSTAASKLVSQSHYNGAVNAVALGRHHRLTPGDVLLGCLPIHHVNGLHFTIFGTAVAGAHVVLAPAFDPFGYPSLIERYRPRIASVVPSILEALAETWRLPQSPPGLDYFVSAAAPLTASAARKFLTRTGVRILQGYGLTETTNFSTTMPPDLGDDAYRRLMLDAEIPSVGVALFGNEVAILRADGTRAETGETGEICMRGHNVMTEYANNPDATAAAFSGGWFHSQDLGFEIRDPAGRGHVVITGRAKNIAKVRGEAVSLDEMDRVLRALPSVRDAACVSRQHRYLGEEIIAAVVWAAGVPADSAGLRSSLETTFASHLLPARFVELDAIPRTPTGKVLRPQLAERLSEKREH